MDDVVGDVQENEPKFSGETSSEQGNYFETAKSTIFCHLRAIYLVCVGSVCKCQY